MYFNRKSVLLALIGFLIATFTLSHPVMAFSPTADFNEQLLDHFTVKLDANASFDPDGAIENYTWESSDGQKASGKVTHITFLTAGEYTMTLTVFDNEGESDTITKTITIANGNVVIPPTPETPEISETPEITESQNHRPTADFLHTINPPSCPTREGNSFSPARVNLEAKASFDPDGSIQKYEWVIQCPDGKTDCTNGETISGEMGTIPLTLSGVYVITLTAIDNDGLSSLPLKKEISVENCPPIAGDFIIETTYSTETITIQLDAAHSDDPDGQIALYQWQSSDGQTANGKTSRFTYSEANQYTIVLTVTDNQGATSTNQKKVTMPRRPSADFTMTLTKPESGKQVPLTVHVDGSFSSTQEGDITAYQWQSSDGQMATGKTARFTYNKVDEYTITLIVTNNHGMQSKPMKKSVSFVHAHFTLEAMRDLETGKMTVHLDGSPSSSVGSRIENYEWQIAGRMDEGMKLENRQFDQCGEEITLTITDKSGYSDSKIKRVKCIDFETVSVEEGVAQTLELVANLSAEMDYEWAVCPEKQTASCLNIPPVKSPQISLDSCGDNYTVSLTITDDLDDTYRTEGIINANCPPKAAFEPHFRFAQTPIRLTLDASASCDKGGHITDYDWLIKGCDLEEEFGEGQKWSLNIAEDCDSYQIKLTVTDNAETTDTIEQEISTVSINTIARSYPQVIAAGVSPSQVDNEETQFDVIALVRPGQSSIHQVSFQDSNGNLRKKMTNVGVLANGDEVYKHTYTIEAGQLDGMTFSTAWGSDQGQFNIIAMGQDKVSCENQADRPNHCHTFPYLRISRLPAINDIQPSEVKKPATPITYKNEVRQRPQVIMAGYSPAILHIGDDEFDVFAVVRKGALSIESVTLKNNSEQAFLDTMMFIGELENGDKVYKMTFNYAPGSLGTPEEEAFIDYKDLWGPSAEQFGIVVYDQDEIHSHQFPDIQFGDYPAWDKPSTNCER